MRAHMCLAFCVRREEGKGLRPLRDEISGIDACFSVSVACDPHDPAAQKRSPETRAGARRNLNYFQMTENYDCS
jgi:hypothetical protein